MRREQKIELQGVKLGPEAELELIEGGDGAVPIEAAGRKHHPSRLGTVIGEPIGATAVGVALDQATLRQDARTGR
jgi:hypothetical protein